MLCRRRINSYSSISILDPDHDSDIMPLMSANPEDNTQQPATGYDIGSPYLPPEYTEEPIRLQYPSSTNWSDICFAPTSQQVMVWISIVFLFIYILSMCVHPLAHLCPMAATLTSHNYNTRSTLYRGKLRVFIYYNDTCSPHTWRLAVTCVYRLCPCNRIQCKYI